MKRGGRLLVVTNDFPPRQGGIQHFVYELACRLPAERMAVYCSEHEGSAAFDADLNFPVRRHNKGLLLPTPSGRARVLRAAADFGADTVWFGAAAPLGLLAESLRSRGTRRIVATTHGHEVGWAKMPLGRQALRRIARSVDVMTYLGEYTRRRLAPVVTPHTRLEQLTPGVDTKAFRPELDATFVRDRYDLQDKPVVVCVSRLVPRKGQDTLIRAMPLIRQVVPDAMLMLVGSGSYEQRLKALAQREGITDAVIFTGGVDYRELPAHFAAGDVFAMPCRTRHFGLDVEGLGMVFLEASASGLPVVAGNSGGAPDALLDGETGRLVDGRDLHSVAGRVTELLLDRPLAETFGEAGRKWVEQSWQWDSIADRLAELLQL
jgi:phosphatidylinositol alpha-1,6-mannosyltransferase